MKAVVVSQFVKEPSELVTGQFPDPQPKDKELLVKVHACGVNFFDILLVQGKYQVRPKVPFVPGAEFAGEVLQVGKSVTRFKPGDRVFGSTQVGAYAELLAVSEDQALPIPSHFTYEQAAGLHITYPTSYAALVLRGNLKAGETCLVHAAAGGVGIAAVQIARALGATVIGTVGSDDKIAVAKEAGCHHVINYQKESDWVAKIKELTKGKGADVIYDPVGLAVKSSSCIAWNGRILVVGFAGSGGPENFPTNRVLLKNASLSGVFWGAYTLNEPDQIPKVWKALFDLFDSRKLVPVLHPKRYHGLETLPEALKDMAQRKIVGKAVLLIQQGAKL